MKTNIGIDLGTTNCCLAWMQGDRVNVYKDQLDRTTIPSIVAEDRNGDILVGWRGKVAEQPLNRHGFFKRAIGTNQKFRLKNGLVEARDLSAYLLKELKERAEAATGGPVAAVITVPAHFESIHISETERAAEQAGLEVLYILREPIAAALAYYHESRDAGEMRPEETILVYDLGGGTFDATVCVRQKGHISVGARGRAYEGDKFLGGYDFDKALVRLAAKMLEGQGFQIGRSLDDQDQAPISLSSEWLWDLFMSAEACKKRLSDDEEVQWTRDLVMRETGRQAVLDMWITRKQFQDSIKHLVGDTLGFCDSALVTHASTIPSISRLSRREEKLKAAVERLSRIMLVGGSTVVPYVKERIAEHYPGIEIKSYRPYECVAIGAAIYAATFKMASALGEGGLIKWQVGPLDRVGDDVDMHPELMGTVVNGNGGDQFIHLALGDDLEKAQLDRDNCFRFPPFRLSPGENRLEFTVLDSDLQVKARETYKVTRGGVFSFSEPGLARPISIRVVDGFVELVPVGTRPGPVSPRPLYIRDKSGRVRAPCYEGHHPIGSIEFNADVAVGTPVVFEIDYDHGRLGFDISVGNLPPIKAQLELNKLDLPDNRDDLLARLAEIEAKIEEQLSRLPKDVPRIEAFTRERDALVIDLRIECENLIDVARVDDRLRQLEVLSWRIQVFSQTSEGLRHRIDGVRSGLKEEGGHPDLVSELKDIERKIPESEDPETIAALDARLNDIVRKYYSRRPVRISASQVASLEKQIRSKIDSIARLSGNESWIRERLETIETVLRNIGSLPPDTNLIASRLWDLEFGDVNPLYQQTVIKHGRDGLLSRTPPSDSTPFQPAL